MLKYFEQNSQFYSLEVCIASTENNDYPNTVSLDQENIGLFRYVNELNEPCPTATLDYIDKNQAIDRFIGKQYVVCTVTLSHMKMTKEGQISTKEEKESEKTPYGFLINNIEILERFGDQILYRIHLVSTIWTFLMRNVRFTNYKDSSKNQNLIDILKEICKTNQIPIDDESWGKCKSTSNIKYISGNNDNFYTAYRFLMNKSFFNQKNTLDGALKAVTYNDKIEKLCMFDLTNDFKYQGLVNVSLNMLKNKTFDLENCSQINIACVINKSNTSKMEGLFPTTLFSYNFDTNEIENESIGSKKIREYCSGTSMKNESIIPILNENLYNKDYSLWDNNMNLYNSSFSSVKDYNGLIVNIEGVMSVNPGWKCGVSVRSAQEIAGQSPLGSQYLKKQIAQNYKQFEGGWYVSKVIYLVNPMKKMFRQNLYLMRTENMVP